MAKSLELYKSNFEKGFNKYSFEYEKYMDIRNYIFSFIKFRLILLDRITYDTLYPL